LKSYVLRFGKDQTPFLSENEIPHSMHMPLYSPSMPTSETTSSSMNSFPEEHIQLLMNLGANKEKAIALLHRAHGNVDIAASMLF
jgi:hypothetical protein